MIEYGVGVQIKKTIEIKKIDYDYFHPEWRVYCWLNFFLQNHNVIQVHILQT